MLGITKKTFWSAALGFFSVGLVFFLIGIQFPKTKNFDEAHYVPSAKQFLELKENQNWEHPPLAKELMAAGIALWGDRPIGWRFMSAVFGAFTLVGMYFWGLALFRNQSTAVWIALISLFNHLLYVQARIGMLDTFMFGFSVWALALFSNAWHPETQPKQALKLHLASGTLFGLAMACKWAAMIPWITCLGLLVLAQLLGFWGVVFKPSHKKQTQPQSQLEGDWYFDSLSSQIRFREVILAYLFIPALFYFLTFLPFLWVQREPHYQLLDLLKMQFNMYDGQLRVVSYHPYMSAWTSWPWIIRPIWYAFDKEGPSGEWVRGVVLLGNPLVMWAGIAAIIYCYWSWIADRSRVAFLISAAFASLYFCWAVIPRKVAFYYYYYPAGMTLSLALAYSFDQLKSSLFWLKWAFLAGVAILFIYFFPVLSGTKIPANSFREWMWFSSWI